MQPLAFIPSADLSPLVESAFRGLLLAVLVAAGLVLLRVRNVVAQKTAWVLTLAAAFAIPAFTPFALRLSIPGNIAAQLFLHRSQRIVATTRTTPIAPAITQPQTDELLGPVTDADTTPFQHLSSSNPPSSGAGAASSPFMARPALPALTRMQFLFLLYCGVCLTLLFRLLRGALVAQRLWRNADPADDPRVTRFTGSIPVRGSTRIASPLNINSGILLPAGFANWDDEKLAVVLAHETSHVRQRDFYLQLATQLYAAIFWFSPLGWWMGRKLSDLSEAISDRAGLQSAASPAAYAQVLLEFAALARPSLTGVAMARPGRLTQRIERLLNESSFRQAFTASRLRIAAAVALVPASLFAATALVRVQAAQVPQAPVAPPPAAEPPQQPAPAPEAAPGMPAKPDLPSPPALPKPSEPGAPELIEPLTLHVPATVAISPQMQAMIHAQVDKVRSNMLLSARTNALIRAKVQADMARFMTQNGPVGYWLGSNQDPYVIVKRANHDGLTVHVPKTRTWHNMYDSLDDYKADIDKAERVAHGDFIWFLRDGKSYVIDDPSILAQINPMQNRIDALGKQQEALGKQQDALGKQQEELNRQMQQVRVPTPDMQKELAKLQAVQAKLAAVQGKDASQGELSEIESELADVQGRIGALQGNMGGRMGDIGGKMGVLGQQQGELGAKQGRLGAEQGRLARELDGKVLSLIDESLKNGKARPVN